MGEADHSINLCPNLPNYNPHKQVFECLPYKDGWFSKIVKLNIILYLYLLFFIGLFFFASHSINNPKESMKLENSETQREAPRNATYSPPLICSPPNTTQKCPVDNCHPTTFDPPTDNGACPEYFKWIKEDLKPWKMEGITREMVEAGKGLGCFRLVVVSGKAYVEKYRDSFQTRDVFTIWGILQLLRLYPTRLPDLDLTFECNDNPVVHKAMYNGSYTSFVSPVFHYCGDHSSYDIVFPDWSFWGWPEINVKPWEMLVKDLEEANERIKWEERKPFAYWKGNLHLGLRKYLANCNLTKECGAHIYQQKWHLETKRGFKDSNLVDQCTHRYKIYMEGKAWSVSEKYIQACDSMLLLVRARYYEFFTRSLVPMKHYWPIKDIRNMCASIKIAVDWGNKNPNKAKEIGKEGSKFIMEDLKMRNVYDYMFHLLNEYGKLLKYKPTVPFGALEVCSETMACLARGPEKMAKMETLIKTPSKTSPCNMID